VSFVGDEPVDLPMGGARAFRSPLEFLPATFPAAATSSHLETQLPVDPQTILDRRGCPVVQSLPRTCGLWTTARPFFEAPGRRGLPVVGISLEDPPPPQI